MLETWLYALGSVLVISSVSLIGVTTLGLGIQRLRKLILGLVSFSVGALFGSAFFHLLPEAFELQGYGPTVPFWALVGLLLFFVLEKFIHWRHCHVPASEEHLHPVVFMNFVGDGLHNFIDGILIGAAFLISVPIGIATSVAVLAHEIPQEMGDFGTLVFGGLSVRKALLFNFISGLFAVVGAVVVLLIGPRVQAFADAVLPLTAGGFIYIAGSDLIPELHKKNRVRDSVLQLSCILAGLALMWMLSATFAHSHGPGHEHGPDCDHGALARPVTIQLG
jgi:zinc and cadmium transporter